MAGWQISVDGEAAAYLEWKRRACPSLTTAPPGGKHDRPGASLFAASAFVEECEFSWPKGNGTYPRNMYENSIRVPFIMSQPGRLPEGVSTDALVSAYDFMPTLLDYMDLPMPATNLPGSSFLSRVGRPSRPTPESSETLDLRDDRETVVIFDEYGPVRMIRTAEWKYVYRHGYAYDELWDLVNDPEERENLIDVPSQTSRVRELKGEMEGWFARYVLPEHDGLGETDTRD